MSLQHYLERIRKNILILLASSGVATLLTFVTVALNSRALGAEGLGILILLQSYAALVIGFFSIGSQQPIISIGSRYLREGQKQKMASLISLGLIFDIAAAACAGTLALTLTVFFLPEELFYRDLDLFVILYALSVFFSGTSAMIGVLRLYDRFYLIAAVTVGHAAVNFIGSLIFFMAQADVKYYILFFAATVVLAQLAHFVMGFAVMRSNGIILKLMRLCSFERTEIREFVSYAWTTWSTSTLNTTRDRLDVLLLGVFAGVTAVGIYGVARQLTGVLNKLRNASTSAVFPEVARLAASSDDGLARILWKRLAGMGLVLGFVVTLLAYFLGPFVLKFGFGAEFEEASTALTLLFCAATLMLASSTFGGFIQAFVSPLILFNIYAASTLAFLVMSMLIVFDWGFLGAALAQITFSLSLFLLSVIVLQRRFGR